MKVKEQRNLSGIYFRVERPAGWKNVCFEDLSAEEQNKIMLENDKNWLMSLAQQLANTLNELGNHFDIMKG
jgi:hypothetical protein